MQVKNTLDWTVSFENNYDQPETRGSARTGCNIFELLIKECLSIH